MEYILRFACICVFLNARFFLRFCLKSKLLVTADFGIYDSGGRNH